MVASKTVIYGRFVFQADVLPKGARKPRRIDLWAPAEFDITTVAPDDLAADAILVQPRLDDAGHAGAIPLALAAWNGGLWSPMKPIEPGGTMGNMAHLPALTVEQYLVQCSVPFVDAWYADDPIVSAFNSVISAHEQTSLPPSHTVAEDAFAGKIMWTNRTEALRRHQAAAANVLFAGDHVYARRPEPTWSVTAGRFWFRGPQDSTGGIILTGLKTYNTLQRFRLDRLEDAAAWRDLAHPQIDKNVYGEILAADFSLLRRDDFACMVSDRMSAPLHGQATMALPYFSDEGLAAWRTLSDATPHARPAKFLDERADLSVDEAARCIRILTRELRNPAFPRHIQESVDIALEAVHSMVLRADFEKARAPKPELNVADDSALMTLGATP